MKRYISILMGVLFLNITFVCAQQSNKILSYTPLKPFPGTELTVHFNSVGTILETAKNITAIIYSVKQDVINCEEYPMAKTEAGWMCRYNVPDTCWSLGVKFCSGDKQVDDAGRNYAVFLYDKNEKLMAGTKASSAYLHEKRGKITAKPDPKLAYVLYKEEFTENPSMLKYFYKYFTQYAMAEDSAQAAIMMAKILPSIDNEKEPDENTLASIESIYRLVLKNIEKANYYKTILLQKYPAGEFAASSVNNDILKQIKTNPQEGEKVLSEFKVKYPNNKRIIRLTAELIKSFCRQKMYDSVKNIYLENKDSFNADINNMSIISDVAEYIYYDGQQLALAKEIIDNTLVAFEKLRKKSRPNPSALTPTQYKGYVNYLKIAPLCAAGIIYNKLEGAESAIRYIEEAYLYGNVSREIKIFYAKLLFETNKPARAQKITEELLIDGIYSKELQKINSESYKLVNGTDKGYEEYWQKIKERTDVNITEEIKKKMVDEPAQDFTLNDLAGKKVSLSDFKGKVVIIDFWATWCVPCKASFPYIKKAIQKYADDNNVKFIFINTYENQKTTVEDVKRFISQNNYPFDVLLDKDSKTANKYGLTGIPTKIFIDKNGNKRYMSAGFDENKILDEIDILVKLLN